MKDYLNENRALQSTFQFILFLKQLGWLVSCKWCLFFFFFKKPSSFVLVWFCIGRSYFQWFTTLPNINIGVKLLVLSVCLRMSLVCLVIFVFVFWTSKEVCWRETEVMQFWGILIYMYSGKSLMIHSWKWLILDLKCTSTAFFFLPPPPILLIVSSHSCMEMKVHLMTDTFCLYRKDWIKIL